MPTQCPYTPTKKLDRFGIRLGDAFGSIDITLWEALGRQCAELDIGQSIFMHRLKTISQDKSQKGFTVVASKDDGAFIYCCKFYGVYLNVLCTFV
jgi:hypothetical protein